MPDEPPGGPGQAPGGVPLLLLHGFLGSGASWTPMRAGLAPARPVLAPDLPGHGGSRGSGAAAGAGAGMEACVGRLARLLDQAGAARADVAGYSMGGRVALALALRHPERVRALVLVSCSAGIADPAERAARRARDEALALQVERGGMEAFVEDWLRQPLFAASVRTPEALARARAARLGHEPAGIAASLRTLGPGAVEPLWDRLGKMEAPALLVSGSLDAAYGKVMDGMAGAMPRARRAVVAGAGHDVPGDAPGALAALVEGFLTRL